MKLTEAMTEPLPEGVKGARVDFREISESETGSPRSKNVVAAGAVLGMLGLPEESAAEIVRDIFHGKSADVVDSNIVALTAGFKEGREQAGLASAMRLAPTEHLQELHRRAQPARRPGRVIRHAARVDRAVDAGQDHGHRAIPLNGPSACRARRDFQ